MISKRIYKLTPEQEARIPIWRDKYHALGASTECADRVRAEAAFARAYRAIGREPVPVHWVASPAADVKLGTGNNFWNSVYTDLGTSLGSRLRSRLRNSLWNSLGTNLYANLRDSLGTSLRDSLGTNLYANLRNSLGTSLRDSLGTNLYANLRNSLRTSLLLGRSYDLHWIAYYKFAADVMGVQYEPEDADKLDIMHEIGLSCGLWYPRQDMIIACERPTITLVDDRLRLHCETGPAMAFSDGFSIHAIHGVRVPADVIEKPITVNQINAEKNTEIQRVMIERFGWDRYASETKIEVIDHDERWGTLMRSTAGLLLRVTNRSPEPDGSFRQYILPVSAQCEPLPDPNDQNGRLGEPQKLTALNAVASTFGMRGDDYGLLQDES